MRQRALAAGAVFGAPLQERGQPPPFVISTHSNLILFESRHSHQPAVVSKFRTAGTVSIELTIVAINVY